MLFRQVIEILSFIEDCSNIQKLKDGNTRSLNERENRDSEKSAAARLQNLKTLRKPSKCSSLCHKAWA
ncbi:hypothetical protein [Acinetobacter pullicarnis]|uniref:hypothetical protein n=1 Tax=Acinetobacter pullicarnis TaxID=2576829 RepID=UPI00111D237B|nr:hypothetical protein [Acinetobacter pullicarnis]